MWRNKERDDRWSQRMPLMSQQKRTFTIAERRRAMGFPDDYVFAGTPPQVDHQLGNAMVVDLMERIYKQILLDTVLPWWLAAGKPGNLQMAWRQAHPVYD